MTELYLIRHARAVEQSAHDWERPLMAEGRAEARAVGAALAKQGVAFDAMIVSPLVRAVETATLIGVETSYMGGLTIEHALTPDGSTSGVLQILARFTADRIALVGHEPSMGQLLSDLSGRPGMSLAKGAVVCLAVDGQASVGGCKIVWSMSPRQLTPARG